MPGKSAGKEASRIATVFGGSGFLGRRIVERLLERDQIVRAASRHPGRVSRYFSSRPMIPDAIEADVLDTAQRSAAIAGGHVVVNAVSLYVEHGELTFERVHVEAAGDLAKASRRAGVSRFIQISGIGSDPLSDSKYIRARGRGEEAVKQAFPGAIIVRPAVMAGPDDAFLTTIVRLVRRLPIYPLFGDGSTKLQPAYVEDVAEAVARLASAGRGDAASVFECAGPRVYSYRELVERIALLLQARTMLMPMPFAVWTALATAAEFVPGAPLTRNQIELMRSDNVAAAGLPGFEALGIEPRGVEEVLRMIA
jgi:NADH dehydrogenase